MTAKEDAADEAAKEAEVKQGETVEGGDFIVDGVHVNSEGVPLKDVKKK